MPRKLPRNVIDVFGNFAFLTYADPGEKYIYHLNPQFAFPRSDRCRDPGSGARQTQSRFLPKTVSSAINSQYLDKNTSRMTLGHFGV
ncbi:hypothetical protein MRB53_023508 [Persea americana]|uniref:Uncharacterized protein n=1 Tax=Persea americana TaxID=3435 RepID=A0ACC2LAA9_PERAE|nr:hypothetical protein MRB53_023508 [Persea americana]